MCSIFIQWLIPAGLSGPARATETLAFNHTSHIVWAAQLTRGFSSSPLNLYLLVNRARELLSIALRPDIGLKRDVEALRERFAAWRPRTRPHQQLREALIPLFGSQDEVESLAELERMAHRAEKTAPLSKL